MIELFTAIICSCLVCYRPLVIKIVPKWLPGGSSFKVRSSEKSSSTIKLKKSKSSFQDAERVVTPESSNPITVTEPLPEPIITDLHQNRGARARISDLETSLGDISESREDALEVIEKEGF